MKIQNNFANIEIIKHMKITLSTKNISLDEPLRIFVEEKIGGLEKFIGKDHSTWFDNTHHKSFGASLVEAKIEIGMPSKHHRSGRVYYTEVNLKVGGKLLRATCQHEDLRNAIVDVKNELQQQIKKLKNKKKGSIP